MIQINETIFFDESKPLVEQSVDFSKWYNENVNSKINLETTPIGYDEYDRPLGWDIVVDDIVVEVRWFYIEQSKSSWACSKHEINIRKGIK